MKITRLFLAAMLSMLTVETRRQRSEDEDGPLDSLESFFLRDFYAPDRNSDGLRGCTVRDRLGLRGNGHTREAHIELVPTRESA